VDATVHFRRLDRAAIRRIVEIQLARHATLLSGRDVTLEVTDRAKDRLAELGFDPQYGARPLRRAIRTRLLDPLARALIAGEFAPGTVVRVDLRDGDLVFERG
jgi:ATP-dependent Clp protease ATP-binding subunit ClpB